MYKRFVYVYNIKPARVNNPATVVTIESVLHLFLVTSFIVSRHPVAQLYRLARSQSERPLFLTNLRARVFQLIS